MTDTDDIDALVRAECLRDYFRQGSAAALFVLLATAMLCIQLWSHLPHVEIVVWYGTILLLQLARIGLSIGFRRADPAASRVSSWSLAAVALSATLALTLNFGGIWFTMAGTLADEVFIILILTVFAAGSLSINAFHPPAMYAFIALNGPPYLIYLWLRDDALSRSVAVAGGFYPLYLFIMGRQQVRTLRTSVMLRHENTLLVAQLRQQAQALDEAGREKSRFFAAASHDLRQPLHALGLYASLLRHQVLPEAGRNLTTRISACVDSLDELFSNILDVSHAEMADRQASVEVFPVQRLVDRIILQNLPVAEAKGLVLRSVRSSLTIHGDRAALERILGNLVSNAIRNTERGRIVVGFRRRGETAVMQVLDTGKGITAEHQAHIFNEFYQVDNPQRDRTRGVGLGLSIVKRLCAATGYGLSLRSIPGRGSAFGVEIPLLQHGLPATSQELAPLAAQPQILGSVLLVDDDAGIRDAMARIFEDWNVDARLCESAEEGLDAIADNPERWQHFILDLRLGGGMSGLQLAQALLEREVRPAAIMLLTGETGDAQLLEARKHGLTVLHKPIKPMRIRAFLTSSPSPRQLAEVAYHHG